jgi:hypothetical protein
VLQVQELKASKGFSTDVGDEAVWDAARPCHDYSSFVSEKRTGPRGLSNLPSSKLTIGCLALQTLRLGTSSTEACYASCLL